MKANIGSRDTVPPLLTSALDGIECSTSRLGRFTPGKTAGTNYTRGWVGPGPFRTVAENLPPPTPHPHSIPGLSNPQQVAIPITLSQPAAGFRPYLKEIMGTTACRLAPSCDGSRSLAIKHKGSDSVSYGHSPTWVIVTFRKIRR